MSETRLRDTTETRVMSVRENSDGYWYIGSGKSIADGPFRYPQQLLTVAADLLSAESRWRIEVFDRDGKRVIIYSSDEIAAGDLNAQNRQRQWRPLNS